MPLVNEVEIIARVRDGDADAGAFSKIVEHYEAPIIRHPYRRIRCAPRVRISSLSVFLAKEAPLLY